jgi:hypothetical protein
VWDAIQEREAPVGLPAGTVKTVGSRDERRHGRHTKRAALRLGKWERHLLTVARRAELDARAAGGTKGEADQRRAGVQWRRELLADVHLKSEPLDASEAARVRFSRAAGALGVLERDKGMVRVVRAADAARGPIESYRLLRLGRVRADELLEHGGKTADMVRREEQAQRSRSPMGRLLTGYQGHVDDLRADLDDAVFRFKLEHALESATAEIETGDEVIADAAARGDFVLLAAMKWLRLSQWWSNLKVARGLAEHFDWPEVPKDAVDED